MCPRGSHSKRWRQRKRKSRSSLTRLSSASATSAPRPFLGNLSTLVLLPHGWRLKIPSGPSCFSWRSSWHFLKSDLEILFWEYLHSSSFLKDPIAASILLGCQRVFSFLPLISSVLLNHIECCYNKDFRICLIIPTSELCLPLRVGSILLVLCVCRFWDMYWMLWMLCCIDPHFCYSPPGDERILLSARSHYG
jgi:hypothetical protein